MKKILCLIALMLALVLALVSCGGDDPTIEISEDGYWVINGEKTDVLAKGEKGDKGDTGAQGPQGAQGAPGDKGDKGDATTSTDENPHGLAFFLKDDGTYAVEIGYAKYLSKIEIPATYNGKAVTEIGELRSKALKELTIPSSITCIGTTDVENLERIHISDLAAWCAIEFKDYFYDEWSLYLNDILITDLVIPEGVTAINADVFSGCFSLASVTIPDSVKTIGGDAFSNCESLASVTIGNGVTSIGEHAFCGCTSLTSVTIPDSVTNIGSSAFSGCSNITSVTIENGVETIGEGAFYECTNLTSVTIPDSVETIGFCAFEYCHGLTIYAEAAARPDGWQGPDWNLHTNQGSMWDYWWIPVVWDCNNNETADNGFVYVVIDGVRYGLKEGVATVAKQPYKKEARIAATVSYKGVTYPVISIASDAFGRCEGFHSKALLETVIIPSSIGSIGARAFNCYLSDVYYTGSEAEWEEISLGSQNNYLTSDATIHYNYNPEG